MAAESSRTAEPTFDGSAVSTLELRPGEPAQEIRSGWWMAPDSGLTSIQELARRLGILDDEDEALG